MNTATATARPAARPGGRANMLPRAAQIVLAAFFAFAAVPKLAGAHTAVTMFGQIAAGQWLRYLVGLRNSPGRPACSSRGWRGWPRPGWPLTWRARPSSMPPCCTAPQPR